MSASTLDFAGNADSADRHNMRAGYTSISAGTMEQLATAIAADTFNVPLREVRAGIHEQQGQLSVSLAVPLVLERFPETGSALTHDGGTIFERAASAQSVVATRLHELAGTSVSRVDVRFTGIWDRSDNGQQRSNARRVR